jgi:hypothetical protein
MPAKCRANASSAIRLASSKIDAGGDAAWKVGKRDAVVTAGVLVDQRNVLPHGYLSLIWACRSMLPGLDAGR